MRKQDVKVGMRVTTNTSVKAYYSGYAGRRVCVFYPGDEGVVGSVDVPPVTGTGPNFVCVDFTRYGEEWRCALLYREIVGVTK